MVRRCDYVDDEQPIITFYASYPTLLDATPAQKAINRSIEDSVRPTVDPDEECSDVLPLDKSVEFNKVGEDCRVSRVGAADLLSIRCRYAAAWKGMRRPFGTISYLNYDLRTGRELRVDDVSSSWRT